MKIYLKAVPKVVLGCFLYAFGLSVFLQPNSIAPGGFAGISILLNHITGIPTGTAILIMNIPLWIIAYSRLGRYFMIVTIGAVLFSSQVINILNLSVSFDTDPLLACIYGGILVGLGLGFVFSTGASTGGSDIITRLIQLSKPHMSLGQIMLSLDCVVIILSAVVFNDINVSLYAIITLYISSKVIDSVIDGPDLAKLVYIISEKNDEIGSEIGQKLIRGSTLLSGTGSYTKVSRTVLMCAMRRQQIPQCKQIASEIDPNAFMIVTDVREVLGYGFKFGGRKVGN